MISYKHFNDRIQRYLLAKAEYKTAKDAYTEARGAVLETLLTNGDDKEHRYTTNKFSAYISVITRNVFDTKLFSSAHPKLYSEYLAPRQTLVPKIEPVDGTMKHSEYDEDE